MTKYCEREDATFWGKLKIELRQIWRGEYNELPDMVGWYMTSVFAIVFPPMFIFFSFADDGEPAEYLPMVVRVALLFFWYTWIISIVLFIILDKGGKNTVIIFAYMLGVLLGVGVLLGFSYMLIEVFGTGD